MNSMEKKLHKRKQQQQQTIYRKNNEEWTRKCWVLCVRIFLCLCEFHLKAFSCFDYTCCEPCRRTQLLYSPLSLKIPIPHQFLLYSLATFRLCIFAYANGLFATKSKNNNNSDSSSWNIVCKYARIRFTMTHKHTIMCVRLAPLFRCVSLSLFFLHFAIVFRSLLIFKWPISIFYIHLQSNGICAFVSKLSRLTWFNRIFGDEST